MILAATLLGLGYPIHAVEAVGNSALRLFVFLDVDGLAATIESFWKEELLLEPQNLLQAYEDVKSQMRSRVTKTTY
jgi:hypothetical protein